MKYEVQYLLEPEEMDRREVGQLPTEEKPGWCVDQKGVQRQTIFAEVDDQSVFDVLKG